MNLNLFIVVPLVTAMAILIWPRTAQARGVALTGAVVQLLLSLVLIRVFASLDHPGGGLVFEQQYPWFPSWGISWHVGVDGISVAMVALTAFVVLAGVLVSWNLDRMPREFYFLLILLSVGAYGFFISLDFFLLFFFLELAVIPKFLLIAIWGSGKKDYSANKLALMLMGGSALVLVGMLGLYVAGGMQSFDLMKLDAQHLQLSAEQQKILFPLLFVGFGVFGALFPFHTWVPDGHSSAPTAGSMFLAGISMKLGGYGCLRVATWLMPEATRYYSPVIIALSAIAILYGAFATLTQKDLKYINAYSSVSHCGFVLLGIGMFTKTAIAGAVFQMVSHGLMTALFFAVIGMIYDRSHTRMVAEMGGLMKVMPFIITALFIAGLCSLGLPGFSGFVAEMTVFVGSWETNDFFARLATVAACASIVVTAVYILRAISQVAMGPVRNASFTHLRDAAWNDRLAVILLVTGIVLVGVAPFLLNHLIAPELQHLLTENIQTPIR